MHEDTHPIIARMLEEHYRSLEPWQRLEIVCKLNRRSDAAAMVGLQERHPVDDERQIRLRLAAMKHGRDLIARAYRVNPESLDP